MPAKTPAQLLAQAIEENREDVDTVLRHLYASERSPPDLEAFEIVMGKEPLQLAIRMLDMIGDEGLFDRFAAALRRYKINLQPVAADKIFELVDSDQSDTGLENFALHDAAINKPFPKDHFDNVEFSRFLDMARGFRCLVRVDGQIKGSGAFISPRLVLTAWHVISSKGEKKIPKDRVIEVWDSEKKWHRALIDYSSPCHEVEWDLGLPEGAAAEKHHDALVLRISEPVGHVLGHIDLPPEPLVWDDGRFFTLIHFPEGEERGVGINAIEPNDGNAVRVHHKATTAGGSSGGPCFNLEGEFLGFHQGRLAEGQKRLVPYNRFAADPKFLKTLEEDRDPPRLWSLDNSLESDFILGRKGLFSAAGAMKGDRHDNIRGLWVQRVATDSDAGLSFTYEILERYLDPKKHRLIRISADLSTEDFIERAAAAIGEPAAMKQIAQDHDPSRIRSLAEWLNAFAIERGEKIWLFVDNPVSGLIGQNQKQLGQFVTEMLRHPQLRTVLTGFETYRLDIDIFSTLDMAKKSSAPGYFREFIGRFNKSDVRETLKLIGDDVGMRWGRERRDEATYRVLHNVEPSAGSHYAMSDIGKVVGQIAAEVRQRQRFETIGFG